MEICLYETLPRDVLDGVQRVHQAVFDGDMLKESKLDKPYFVALIASEGNEVLGFKFGYEIEPGIFYSWLGGVHPNYRGRGIAQQLMEEQHNICRKHGYEKIRTYSRNTRKAMLIVNIKAGFDIISTFVDDKGRHKIMLEKRL